ncbi:TIM barrel protein [Rhizobium sp. Root1220]|uniref:TIM barrel protein n=1 Tax=Rhizobium sp. Root1220 TaxID=1736432 RepID=UPI0006FE4953|nr:TIM barrel protein [Rhizobium sp. Root1220]KQV80024.1 hydroxypyruvate isomerase [Rhizobium sp. Root1220]
MKLSACIEWLFADEAENFADRIRLAHGAGLDTVEFWRWTNKDLGSIEWAVAETGIQLASFVAEPMIPLTDIANKGAFLEGLKSSIETARRLGAHTLIAQAGDDLAGKSRDEQAAALVEILTRAGELLEDSGVRLGVEPLNTLIDHVGYFLHSTVEGIEIVRATGRPEIGIIYDVYHSAVMGEDTAAVIGGDVDRVFHVHIADHPGRNEPGSGVIDLKTRLDWLFSKGYNGAVGLEYRPLASSAETIAATRRLLA